MNESQNHAIEVEGIMRRVFPCDRFGFGGLVNSDYIRTAPFLAMMCTLTYLYGRRVEEAANFFEKYSAHGKATIDEWPQDDFKEALALFKELCKE